MRPARCVADACEIHVRRSSEAASAKSDDGCAFVVLLLPPGRASSSDEVAALPRFLDGTAFEDGFAG